MTGRAAGLNPLIVSATATGVDTTCRYGACIGTYIYVCVRAREYEVKDLKAVGENEGESKSESESDSGKEEAVYD